MKHLSIKGNPGQDNTFTEVIVKHGGHNPAAQIVVNNYFFCDKKTVSQMIDFDKLQQEICEDIMQIILTKLAPNINSFLGTLSNKP